MYVVAGNNYLLEVHIFNASKNFQCSFLSTGTWSMNYQVIPTDRGIMIEIEQKEHEKVITI